MTTAPDPELVDAIRVTLTREVRRGSAFLGPRELAPLCDVPVADVVRHVQRHGTEIAAMPREWLQRSRWNVQHAVTGLLEEGAQDVEVRDVLAFLAEGRDTDAV